MSVQEPSVEATNHEAADPSLALALSPPHAPDDELQRVPRSCLASNSNDELLSRFNWNTLLFEDSACEESQESYIFGTGAGLPVYTDWDPTACDTGDAPMADFLASFDFSGTSTAHPSEKYCLNLDDVKSRLRTELDGRVSATRAHAVDASIDVASQARLEVAAAQPRLNEPQDQAPPENPMENGTQPAAEAPDQAAPDQVAPAPPPPVQPALAKREVMASEGASNQPAQDPELQTAISNSLVQAVSEVDICSWELEGMVLEKDGWTFTYACTQAWRSWTKRDNSLGALDIGDYNKKVLDLHAADRPAFDCRGTVSVTFKRSNKMIKINYSHIPIHNTVGNLWQSWKPVEAPAPALYPTPKRAPAKPKTAKPRTPRTPKTAGTKRSRKSGPEDDGSSKRRSCKKKNTTLDTPLTLEENMASLAQEVQRLSSVDATTSQPNGRAISAIAPGTPTTAQAWGIAGISAAEAARRREVAAKLLSDNNIDASTLSAHQFSVLSNQAPELQKRSIEMLVKYGAESLRIVQPTTKNAGKTSFHPTDNEPSAAPVLTPKSGKRQRTKSRVICFNCKASKSRVKCSKELPTCIICLQSGLVCEFPPPRPRNRKSRKPASDAEAEAEEEAEEAEEADRNSDAEWEEDNEEPSQAAREEPVEQGYGVQPHLFQTSQSAAPSLPGVTSNSIQSYSPNLTQQQAQPVRTPVPLPYQPSGLHTLANAVGQPQAPSSNASSYPAPPGSESTDRSSVGYPYTTTYGGSSVSGQSYTPTLSRAGNSQSGGLYMPQSYSPSPSPAVEQQGSIAYAPYSYNQPGAMKAKVPPDLANHMRNNSHGRMGGRR